MFHLELPVMMPKFQSAGKEKRKNLPHPPLLKLSSQKSNVALLLALYISWNSIIRPLLTERARNEVCIPGSHVPTYKLEIILVRKEVRIDIRKQLEKVFNIHAL